MIDFFQPFRQPAQTKQMRTVVTISTSNWVTARSGAENQTKVTQVTSPAPPIRISAAKPVVLRLKGRADGAGDAHGPDHGEERDRTRREGGRNSEPVQRSARARRVTPPRPESEVAAAGVGAEMRFQQRAQRQHTVTSTRSKMR